PVGPARRAAPVDPYAEPKPASPAKAAPVDPYAEPKPASPAKAAPVDPYAEPKPAPRDVPAVPARVGIADTAGIQGLLAVQRVDAGTLEVIRAAGVTVKSSDTLVQFTKAIWGDAGRTSHYVAVHHLVELRKEALAFVAQQVQAGATVTEFDVQQRLVHGLTMR